MSDQLIRYSHVGVALLCILFKICPCFKFGFIAANGTIIEAFKDEKRVHIIDFDINQGNQYITLVQTIDSIPQKVPSRTSLMRVYPSRMNGTSICTWSRVLNPKLVTVVEQDVNTNTAPSFSRFIEAYNYYSAMFDSLDATLPRESQDQINVERIVNSLVRERRG
ncbi:hypothetical protein SAY86_023134 [Trapa natans]|uniref:Uncharacterized protein n=1 Tax=Trapa natans TaxID=22666 RepID=A0AAN7LVC6_TRANT|nr:hypothetical protein SAY86_023134 [Trapa natans]